MPTIKDLTIPRPETLEGNVQRLDTYVTFWKDNALTETCRLLFERTKDSVYQRIQSRFSQTRLL